MLRCSESKSRGTRLHMLFRNLNVMLVTHIRRNIRRNSYTMAAKIRYSKMVKTCKNMIAQHESWNPDIFGRVPLEFMFASIFWDFASRGLIWISAHLSSSQLISAHLSSSQLQTSWIPMKLRTLVWSCADGSPWVWRYLSEEIPRDFRLKPARISLFLCHRNRSKRRGTIKIHWFLNLCRHAKQTQ